MSGKVMKIDSTLLEEFKFDLEVEGKSRHTVRAYVSSVKDFLQWVEKVSTRRDPLRVTLLDLREYQIYILKRRKNSIASVHQKMAAVKCFYSFLAHNGHRKDNPAVSLKPVKRARQQSAPDVLSKQELQAFLKEVHSSGSLRDIAIVELMLNTGIRASELLDLHLDDVIMDGGKGRVVIRHGKGGKYREIPLSPRVQGFLRGYIKVRPNTDSPNLFIGQRGPLRTTDALNKILKKYGRKVGIDRKVHPHLLRHQFATELLRNRGADIALVSELLGHENLNTTMIYTRPTQEDKERALLGLFQGID